VSASVLVVDDDASMCETLQVGLEPRGFEVRWTTSPQEAFDLMQAGTFEAVVTDLNMRGMNGIQLCERIAADRPAHGRIQSAHVFAHDHVAGHSGQMMSEILREIELIARALALGAPEHHRNRERRRDHDDRRREQHRARSQALWPAQLCDELRQPHGRSIPAHSRARVLFCCGLVRMR